MQFKDHRFRNEPPKSYDIVLQLSFEEAEDLKFDIEIHYPDIDQASKDCEIHKLWKILNREKETRETRIENPGSYRSPEYQERLEREMWSTVKDAFYNG